MAYAYVQQGSGLFAGNVITWSQATGAGNLLVVALLKANNTGEYVASGAGNVNTSQAWVSAAGTINNSDSKLATGSGVTDYGSATLLFLPGANNAGGDTSTTFTLHSDGGGNVYISAMEFSGLDSTSPFVNYSLNAQTNAGTSTDAITSNAVTVSTVPSLLCGFFNSNSGGATAATGTGFAGRQLGHNVYWGEDKRITSSSSVAATFTDSQATDGTVAIGMAFKESGGAPAQTNQGFFADAHSGLYLPKPKHVVTATMFMPLAWAINRRNKLKR